MLLELLFKEAIDEYVVNKGMSDETGTLIKKNADLLVETRNLNHAIIFNLYDIDEVNSSGVFVNKNEENAIMSVEYGEGAAIVFNERNFFNNEEGYEYEGITINTIGCLPSNHNIELTHYIITHNVITELGEELEVNHISPVSLTVSNPDFNYKLRVFAKSEGVIEYGEFVLIFDLSLPEV